MNPVLHKSMCDLAQGLEQLAAADRQVPAGFPATATAMVVELGDAGRGPAAGQRLGGGAPGPAVQVPGEAVAALGLFAGRCGRR
jgi:hypothetical protein